MAYLGRASDEETKLDDIAEQINLSDDEIDKEEEDVNSIKKMIKQKQEPLISIEEFLKVNNLQELTPFMQQANLQSLNQLKNIKKEHIRQYMGEANTVLSDGLITALDELQL